MYSMWNANFKDIYIDFKRNQEGKTSTNKPFYFSINGSKLKSKFKIEELDFLTSRFKDEISFAEELSKPEYQNNYLHGYPHTPIIITHVANGRIFQDFVIYNDKFITNITSEIRKKKKTRKKQTPIILDNSGDILDFINYIKSLAIHPTSRKYLLTPEKLPNTIDIEDKYLLKNMIEDDIEINTNNYHGWKKGLRTILNQYLNYSRLLEEKKIQNDSTLEIEDNLNKVNQELNSYFRNDYKNIRNLIVWESLYKTVLEKQISQTEDLEQKQELTSCLEYVKLQKQYRNGRMEPMEWEYYQDIFLGEELPPTLLRKHDVQNDRMLELFEEGGYEAVMNGMSADDIYRNSKDAEALGIIKSNKKK